MNISSIPQMITAFLFVNVAALLMLMVLSYVGSTLALNGLEWLDRRLDPSQKSAGETASLVKPS